MLAKKFKQADIPFGFGGIASIGKGMLPAEKIIREHYRLGSTRVILSRSFCNVNQMRNLNTIRQTFDQGVKDIRRLERECLTNAYDYDYFKRNRDEVVDTIAMICINIDDED